MSDLLLFSGFWARNFSLGTAVPGTCVKKVKQFQLSMSPLTENPCLQCSPEFFPIETGMDPAQLEGFISVYWTMYFPSVKLSAWKFAWILNVGVGLYMFSFECHCWSPANLLKTFWIIECKHFHVNEASNYSNCSVIPGSCH